MRPFLHALSAAVLWDLKILHRRHTLSAKKIEGVLANEICQVGFIA